LSRSFADSALRALPAGIRGVGTTPVYEYECGAGHRFEVTQKFSDRPITACQTCAQPVSKLISAPAIMFKGSGWYITDYSDKLKQTPAERISEGTTSPKKDGSEKEAANPASPLAASAPASSPVSAAVGKE
jgi:putative FmdB family regulatory protein